MAGGVTSSGLRNVTIQIDGTLKFNDDRSTWPKNSDGGVYPCMHFSDAEGVTFTSSGKGTLDGSGAKWWGYINYLVDKENRPRLIEITDSAYILFENILLLNSPYWTFWAWDVTDVEIRNSDVSARRSNADEHDFTNLGK